MVRVFVRLGAQALYRCALSHVEHAHLERGLVRIDAHFAAERIDLAHELTFGGASYRRVARHERDAVEVEGEHEGGNARPREGEGGFAARVSRSDDHGFISVCVKFVGNFHKLPVRKCKCRMPFYILHHVWNFLALFCAFVMITVLK